MTPSISVVIPTYNRAELVGRAIDSVLAQERRPEEVIVVDDCSSDDTPQALASYGKKIRVLRLERNSERGVARNAGVELASGELIAFLDSDDAWEPAKLSLQCERMRPGSVVLTGIRYVDMNGHAPGLVRAPAPSDAREIFVHNSLIGSASSLLVERRAALSYGGFPESRSVQGSEDWLFMAGLVAHGLAVEVIDQPLVRYYVHAGASTQQADNLARSMWWASEAMQRSGIAPLASAGERRSRTASAIANAYLSEGRGSEARPWLRRALRQGPPRARLIAIGRAARTAAGSMLSRGGPG